MSKSTTTLSNPATGTRMSRQSRIYTNLSTTGHNPLIYMATIRRCIIHQFFHRWKIEQGQQVKSKGLSTYTDWSLQDNLALLQNAAKKWPAEKTNGTPFSTFCKNENVPRMTLQNHMDKNLKNKEEKRKVFTFKIR